MMHPPRLLKPLVFILLIAFSHIASSGQNTRIDGLQNLSSDGIAAKNIVQQKLELGTYYSTLQLDSSYFYSHAAMKLSKEINYPVGIGMSLFSLGELASQYDSLSLARKYFFESLEYLNDCNCDSLEAETYFSIGHIYLLHDNYAEAQEFFISSMNLAEDKGYKQMLFKLYFWMAKLYDSMENNEDAEHYYLMSLELSDTLKSDPNTVFSFYNLGMFYLNQAAYLQAEKYLQKALNLSKQLNGNSTSPLLYSELGNIGFVQGKFDRALSLYVKADESIPLLNQTNRLQINYWNAFIRFYKGRCYFKKNDFSRATGLLKQSRDIARVQGFVKLEAEASEYLASIYEKLGNCNAALGYFKDFHNLQDSIISVQNVAKVTKLEMEYRHMKVLHKNKIQQLEAKKNYLNDIHNYRIIIGSAILLLIILVLIFIIYRSSQHAKATREEHQKDQLRLEKEWLQKELEFKNRELTTSVMYLMKKNNFLRTLSEQLKNAILPLKPEIKKPIENIIKETAIHIETDTWEEFEARFNQVHHNFSERLLKDFPDITPNELKLCAFLRLNMSTKEILTITHQSANSISVARHRLRTKLGIDRDENLITFLTKY